MTRDGESVCGWIGESTLEKKAEMERNGWMGEKDKDPKRKRREVSTRYGKYCRWLHEKYRAWRDTSTSKQQDGERRAQTLRGKRGMFLDVSGVSNVL